MDELEVVILNEGVGVEEVAAAAACCPSGPSSLRTEPEPAQG